MGLLSDVYKRQIQTILDGKAPVFHAQGGHAQAETGTAKEGIGHQIYKHLMNGVSNMLPFVIGGGILIAIAFLLDTILAPVSYTHLDVYKRQVVVAAQFAEMV